MLAYVLQSMEKNKARLNIRQAYFNSFQKDWSLDGNSVLPEKEVRMPHFIHETLPISSAVLAAGYGKVKKRRGGRKRKEKKNKSR